MEKSSKIFHGQIISVKEIKVKKTIKISMTKEEDAIIGRFVCSIHYKDWHCIIKLLGFCSKFEKSSGVDSSYIVQQYTGYRKESTRTDVTLQRYREWYSWHAINKFATPVQVYVPLVIFTWGFKSSKRRNTVRLSPQEVKFSW